MASPTADEVADMRRRRAEGASIASIMTATGWGRTAVRNALADIPAAPVDSPGRAIPTARARTSAKARAAAKVRAVPKSSAKAGPGSGDRLPAKPKTRTRRKAASRRAVPDKVATDAEAATATGGAGRGSLVARLWRTADAQVREVERRLRQGEGEPGDREKDARTLAVVVKTLRDLLALETDQQPTDALAPKEKDDDVRDLDDFRRELADRIDRLRRARDADLAAGEL